MTSYGDDVATWTASADALVPVLAAVFVVLVVTMAITVIGVAIWSGIGKS